MNRSISFIVLGFLFACCVFTNGLCQNVGTFQKSYVFDYRTNSNTGISKIKAVILYNFDPHTLNAGHGESEVAMNVKLDKLTDLNTKKELYDFSILLQKAGQAVDFRLGATAKDQIYFRPPQKGKQEYPYSITLLESNGNKVGTRRDKFTYTVTVPKSKTEQTKQPTVTIDPTHPEANIDEEAVAWKRTQNVNTVRAYEDYIKQYPSGRFTADARSKKAGIVLANKKNKTIESSVDTQGNEYTLLFSYLLSKPDFSILGAEQEIDSLYSRYDADENTYEYKVRINGYGEYTFEIKDFEKYKRSQTSSITINNTFKSRILFNEAKDTLRVYFTGGIPPYDLIFIPHDSIGNVLEEQEIVLAELASEKYWSRTELQKIIEQNAADELIKLSSSTFDIKTRDVNRNHIINLRKGFDLDVSAEPTETWEVMPFLYGLAGLVSLLIIIGISRSISRKRKKHRLEEAQDKMRAQQQEQDPEELPTIDKEKEEQPDQPEPSTKFAGGTIGERKSGSSTITITKKHSEEISSDFPPMDWSKAFVLPMSEHWGRSTIESIYFKRDTILEIDEYLVSRNISKMKEQGANIPEIGGMLMGRHTINTANKYKVSVEKFVPISASTATVISLEFSEDSIARDLVAIQDNFPAYKLVGWFHTHPGHGLFLSKSDLKVQYGFFKEPYQFAMEIDSLTENLDTGFFTWQKPDTINNMEHRIGDSWFHWVEFQRFTRRNL